MAEQTAAEQYLLELVNFVRMDPDAGFGMFLDSVDPLSSPYPDIQSALTYFKVSASVLAAQIAELEPAAPLAWNAALGEMADGHSADMLANDVQAHVIGDSTLPSRAKAVDYPYSYVGENVFAYSKSGMHAHAGFLVDWGFTETGIQEGAGHRVNIMNPAFREAGMGILESDGSGSLGPLIVTQNFGVSFGMAATILTGAVRTEKDDDGFYSIGEGRGGVTVALKTGAEAVTGAAGGYRLDAAAGWADVTLSGPGVDGQVTLALLLPDGNAKLDLIDGDRVASSVSLKIGSGIAEAVLLGLDPADIVGTRASERLVGNGGDNVIKGRGGDDVMSGGAGDDVVRGGGRKDTIALGDGADRGIGGGGNDEISGGGGSDVLNGGKGQDRLSGGAGGDTFQFTGAFGDDVITDLDADDRLIFRGKASPDSDAAFDAALSVTSKGVLFDDGASGSILFEGATLAEVEALATNLA